MTSVFPNWSGQVVAVLAGGVSALQLVPVLRGRCRIVAVNLAFRLVPEADVLYAADASFWAHYRDSHDFDGLKVSATDHADRYCSGVHMVKIAKHNGRSVEGIVREPLGVIGSGGGNGGFQAVNLAAQFGATTILLAGLDYNGSHWHADHPTQLRNPTVKQLEAWADRFDAEAGALRAWGVRVINLSRSSSLRAFPHGQAESYLPH